MIESARARLGRRARGFGFAAVGGWLVFVACLFFPAIPVSVMFGAFLLTIGGLLALILGVRCPRCRGAIPQVGVAEAWLGNSPKAAHCPRCNADLTQPE